VGYGEGVSTSPMRLGLQRGLGREHILTFEVKMQGFMHFYSEKLLVARSRGGLFVFTGG